jgi:predicted nucleic acid-binding protein
MTALYKGILLDTSVLINLLHRRKEPTRLVRQLSLSGFQLAISTVNVAEIYAGMRSGEEQETEELLSAFPSFPVTEGIAKTAGEIVASRRRIGFTHSLVDMLIAATAVTHGFALLTDNRKDFEIPGLLLFDDENQ